MKALQAHYTSCRKGLSGHSGFQVRAHSANLGAADLAEIESRNSYRPPLDAPGAPSPEELAQAFPVALRSYRLPSGSYALTRATYAGRDYSGRWGNFFAHTLVVDAAEKPESLGWPIDYFDWEGWVCGLTPEEDTDRVPDPLPLVELGQIERAPSFTTEELARFLAEDSGREALLAAMGQALFQSLADQRPVVIRAKPLDLPFWIGSLQKLLPPALAWDLTISTYEDEPRQSAQITGTSGQTYFSFDESELRFRTYGFDLASGVRSVVAEPGRYPIRAASWLCHQPEKMEAFYQWLSRGAAIEVVDLEPGLDLFCLLEGEDRALDQATEGLLRFAERLEPSLDLLERLLGALTGIGRLQSIAAEAAVFRFLMERAAPLDAAFAAQVLDTWRDHACSNWLEAKEGAEEFETFWRGLVTREDRLFSEAARRWLETWEWLRKSVSDQATERLLHFVLALGSAAQRKRIWRDKPVAQLFQRVATREGGKKKLLALAGRDGRDLLDLLDLLGRDGSETDRVLGRALGAAIKGWPQAPEIRKVLEEVEAWELLFGEWLGRLESCGDPADRKAELAKYERQELSHLNQFRARALPWIRWTVLCQRPASEQISAIHQWLVSGELLKFPSDLLFQCLESGQRALSWESAEPKLDEFSRLLFDFTKERKAQFKPNRARMRLALHSPAHFSFAKKALDEVFDSLEGAAEDEKENFLCHFLTRMLPTADKDAHEKLLASLDRSALNGLAASAYEGALQELDGESLLKIARFWLQSKDFSGLRRKVGDAAETALVAWLAAHPSELAEAEARFPRLRDALPAWERWRKKIAKKRRNPLVRARSWYHSFVEKLPFTGRH